VASDSCRGLIVDLYAEAIVEQVAFPCRRSGILVVRQKAVGKITQLRRTTVLFCEASGKYVPMKIFGDMPAGSVIADTSNAIVRKPCAQRGPPVKTRILLYELIASIESGRSDILDSTAYASGCRMTDL